MSKMASKMEANYKCKYCVIWKQCLKLIFFPKLLAMKLESEDGSLLQKI